ncbi:ABC transporter permease [Hathewaya massiliensis]|uniref:ABC transporter permease n=1 Tax=Hathewaya massiliensis TaxID=1964382 RepID=UPI00115AFB72|nr:iron export ABC transporter permease subunit FetB [Hathewaya massiliensis]
MNTIIDLNLLQMLCAYVFIIILLVIVKKRDIKREREILISSLRMTLQLVIAGYILGIVFKNDNPIYTILILIGMETFSIYNIFKRTKFKLSRDLKKIIALSMGVGTTSSLVYFLFIVVKVTPWYNSRYFIPIGGMLIGNSMTGISLGINTLLDGMISKKEIVETALMLGATPKESCKDIVNHAFDSAILPTINSMVGMGIVFLPGMMTGQILSGTSPTTAISYQIAIMLGVLGSVTLSVILFLLLGYKTFFNEEDQVI